MGSAVGLERFNVRGWRTTSEIVGGARRSGIRFSACFPGPPILCATGGRAARLRQGPDLGGAIGLAVDGLVWASVRWV